MDIYVFIVFVLTFLYLVRRSNNSFIFIIALFLVGFSSLRGYSVGIDQLAYRAGFLFDIRYLPLSDLFFKWEIGWILINKVVMFIDNDWNLMLFFIAILTVIPFIYVFKKDTLDPLLAIWMYFVLYYYILPFSIVKQGVAVSFFVLSIYFLNNNSNKKALFSYVFASVIHYSALGLIPIVYFANKIRIRPKVAIYLISITFLIGLIGFEGPLKRIIELLPFEKYSHYSEYNADVKFDRLNVYLYIFPKNVICAIIFLYLKNDRFNIYKNLFFFGMIIANLFITISLVSRFLMYLYPFEIILLTNYIYQYKKGQKRNLIRFSIMIYCLLFLVYNLLINRGGVIPFELNIK